jgi:hypothetical protein
VLLARIIHEAVVFCSGGRFPGLGLVARIRRRRPVGRPAGDLGYEWCGLRFRGCRGARVRLLSVGRGRRREGGEVPVAGTMPAV